MISLQDTIENFQTYILDNNISIFKHIVGANQDFKTQRLSAYQDSYYYRLLEILAKDFPHLETLAGKERFEQLAHEYINSYPSHHFSIRFFGQHFSQFLMTHTKSQPVFVEMAEFEWALEYAIDAANAPQLTFDEMAKLSPEAWAELTLKVHPSLQILRFYYPTVGVWRAIGKKMKKPALKRRSKPVPWIVWRFQNQSHFRSLTKEQLWMMEQIQAGQPFATICEGLNQWMNEDHVVHFAATTLRDWIVEGIFSEFNPPTPPFPLAI